MSELNLHGTQCTCTYNNGPHKLTNPSYRSVTVR